MCHLCFRIMHFFGKKKDKERRKVCKCFPAVAGSITVLPALNAKCVLEQALAFSFVSMFNFSFQGLL
jgi:hypothetical protein